MLFKRRNKNTWITYQDKLGDQPLSVRVNTGFTKKKYKHTLYIIINYKYTEDKPFPTQEELEKANNIEDRVETYLESNDDIHFIGSATFGGYINLIYVTNLDINWEKSIPLGNMEGVKVGSYLNDNMGYYHKVLYPRHLR